MAERPIFIPCKDAPGMVKEIKFSIPWHSGFAPIQKKRNIDALHAAAAKAGYAPLLEVSSKSDEKAGRHLSAFHLKVHSDSAGDIPLECAFQGSKVFERGGPYTDLFEVEPKVAKRDSRLQESGRLIRFEFDGKRFPLLPMTVFYDWLYVCAIFPHREWLKKRLDGEVHYAGFTDIEFNPNKSVNCQARSCALFVELMDEGLLEGAVSSPEKFIEIMSTSSRQQVTREPYQRLQV